MLAKKITETRKAKQPDPFKKIEFIKLSNIAIEIVAQNFILYPQLEGISIELKNKIIDKVLNINKGKFKHSCENRINLYIT